MKQNIHPAYQTAIFRDKSSDYSFITRSTKTSDETMLWNDGKEYPVINIEISSVSHPFYTGGKRNIDTDGQIAKFRKRYHKNLD